jgi:PAT family beta-lactamase induction signal transducer AmpG
VSLATRPQLRLLTLCLLYVAQGIPWGFMATTLPAYLTDRGLDLGFVTATLSFTTLPYSFKWIWGPIIDSFTIPSLGRRRPWIIFAQGMMAATVIALVAIPDLTIQIKLLAWMILIHTVFNSLQDVAVDALAVDLLADKERGRANGLMYGSKYLGGAIGGIVMANVVAASGLRAALLAQTVILVAIMFVPLLVRESDTPPPARTPPREIARALAQAFSLRSTLVAAVMMLGANFAIGFVTATGYSLFVGTLDWKPEDYTAITGGWGLLLGGVVAGLTGFLTDRFGRIRIAAIASLALAGGWLFFALMQDHWRNDTLIYFLGFYEAAATAMFSVALIAMCMDLSWTKIGGSQFAAYMALSNFSTTLGYQFAAKANEMWDFQGVFLAAAVYQVMITFVLLPIDPLQTRRELKDDGRIRWLGISALFGLLAFLVVMTVYVTMKRLGYI